MGIIYEVTCDRCGAEDSSPEQPDAISEDSSGNLFLTFPLSWKEEDKKRWMAVIPLAFFGVGPKYQFILCPICRGEISKFIEAKRDEVSKFIEAKK